MATRAARGRRKPVYKEVEERESRKVTNRVRAARRGRAQRLRRRYAVPYDIDGPHVRLGLAWFVAALAALAMGPLLTAIVYGGATVVAAMQAARAWRRRQKGPDEQVASGFAAAMALGALLGAGGSGLAILVGVVAAVVVAARDPRSDDSAVAQAGWTVQCALFPGLAAMSMVLLVRLDQGSAIALLLLVSAYETGDYIVGSGAGNPYEGPAAGLAGIVVITFIISTLPISALNFGEAWLFGGAVALLAPLGQLFASALLPAAGSPASALRRLDSLLLAAPAWAWGVGLVL